MLTRFRHRYSGTLYERGARPGRLCQLLLYSNDEELGAAYSVSSCLQFEDSDISFLISEQNSLKKGILQVDPDLTIHFCNMC